MPEKCRKFKLATLVQFHAVANMLQHVQEIIEMMIPLDPATRLQIYHTVGAFCGYDAPMIAPTSRRSQSLSPQDFLSEKAPYTQVERAACLAYYLTYYLDTPHFKTLDVSKVNTAAGQIKFANTASTMQSAIQAGLLLTIGPEMRQLSRLGARYVEALPDRAAAKTLLAQR